MEGKRPVMARRSAHPRASSADSALDSTGDPSSPIVPLRAKDPTPDPRLVELVRLLARQAARDYHAQSRRRTGRDRDEASPVDG